jgi:hypothetical protein
VSTPQEQKRAQLANIEASTGRTVAAWADVLLVTTASKHGQVLARLKTEYGLTHGNANALAHAVREYVAGGPAADGDLLDRQYAGAKATLRPIFDEIVAVARGLGPDVAVQVNKTGVSLRRAKQFAVVEAPSARRIRLGLNLADTGPAGRLVMVGGMCTHAVDITDIDDVDDELSGWLRDAYRTAG